MQDIFVFVQSTLKIDSAKESYTCHCFYFLFYDKMLQRNICDWPYFIGKKAARQSLENLFLHISEHKGIRVACTFDV